MMKTVEIHGLDCHVDKDGTEYINGYEITSWDRNNIPRHNGNFIAGVCPNKEGAKGNTVASVSTKKAVVNKCLAFSLEGVDLLIGFARNEKEATAQRIKAIEIIHDRCLGKPKEAEEVMSPEALVAALPDVFFPGGNRIQ